VTVTLLSLLWYVYDLVEVTVTSDGLHLAKP
jgi:hypothetical protein